MNKIILNFGLLVFCIAVIVFAQQDISILDIILKSFVVFFAVTMMIGILVLVFIKTINKAAIEKGKKLEDNILGNSENE
ncbi:MAG: hypothetical protein JEY94_16340 [Melioribacteraceae bacterium]|nr:hypothetical protein [Melioribacteraceae bacterium]